MPNGLNTHGVKGDRRNPNKPKSVVCKSQHTGEQNEKQKNRYFPSHAKSMVLLDNPKMTKKGDCYQKIPKYPAQTLSNPWDCWHPNLFQNCTATTTAQNEQLRYSLFNSMNQDRRDRHLLKLEGDFRCCSGEAIVIIFNSRGRLRAVFCNTSFASKGRFTVCLLPPLMPRCKKNTHGRRGSCNSGGLGRTLLFAVVVDPAP